MTTEGASADGPEQHPLPEWRAEQAAAARRLLPPVGGNATLDRITALAARLLHADAAQATLLTEVQTVAGGYGLPPGTVGTPTPLVDSLCLVAATSAAPLIVPDARVDDRVLNSEPVRTGRILSYAGVPLVSDSGLVVGALCVHNPRPSSWAETDIELLTQLASSAIAELELAALSRDYDTSRARWDLAVEAGELGTFDWDLLTDVLDWDDRLIAMFGYDQGDVEFDRSIESVNSRLHPDDAAAVAEGIADAIELVGLLDITYRIVLPEGTERWLQARGRALPGPDGTAVRLLGVTFDVTAQQAGEERADRLLASMSVGFVSLDADWRFSYANTEAEYQLGRTRTELLGGVFWDVFPDARETDFGDLCRRVLQTGQTETFELFSPAPAPAWYEIRVVPDGTGVSMYLLDITARRDTQELLQLSVDIGEHLVGVVDIDSAVSALARMLVPRLADWSIIALAEPDGRLRDVQSWHHDPVLRPLVDRYAALRLVDGGSGVVQAALTSARPIVIESGVTDIGNARLPLDAAKQALADLAAESVVVLPLLADNDVAGVLSLYRSADRPPMPAQEVAVCQSLARRAGMAIDNARLYASQAASADHARSVAAALQQAMLTRLPEPEHLQLVARYLPAADEDQVGGDWYDAIVAPDGTTTLMIGDVVGHDIEAAAIMGQLRSMLRAFAWDRAEAPSEILGRLDRAARDLRLATLATLVVARIEPGEGGGHTLRWSNAGHPPPMLLARDGTAVLLDEGRTDPLLGFEPDRERRDSTVSLPAAGTVLFYTDGLIEARGATIDAGFDRLVETLQRHRGLAPDELVDAVLADMIGEHPADDVAVLLVRLA